MADELTAPTSSCCAPETQATCCGPTDKAACCETSAAGGSCGCSAGQSADRPEAPDIRETVRQKYAAAARAVSDQPDTSCCGPVSTTDEAGTQVFGSRLYDGTESEGATAARMRSGTTSGRSPSVLGTWSTRAGRAWSPRVLVCAA